MATITCSGISESSGTLDGGRRPPEAHAHLRECAALPRPRRRPGSHSQPRRRLDRLDPAPPERLWISLRAQLEEEGLIREAVPSKYQAPLRSDGASRGWLDESSPPLPRPGAGRRLPGRLVAVALARRRSGQQARQRSALAATARRASTSPLSAQLDSAEQNAVLLVRDSNPVVTASLQRTWPLLTTTSLCVKKVYSEDPENEAARDYLYEAYQQKADLLAADERTRRDRPMSTLVTLFAERSWLSATANSEDRRTPRSRPAALQRRLRLRRAAWKSISRSKLTRSSLSTIPTAPSPCAPGPKSEVMVIANRATDQVDMDAEQTGNRVDVIDPPTFRRPSRRTTCAPIMKSASPRMPNCRFTTIRAA